MELIFKIKMCYIMHPSTPGRTTVRSKNITCYCCCMAGSTADSHDLTWRRDVEQRRECLDWYKHLFILLLALCSGRCTCCWGVQTSTLSFMEIMVYLDQCQWHAGFMTALMAATQSKETSICEFISSAKKTKFNVQFLNSLYKHFQWHAWSPLWTCLCF